MRFLRRIDDAFCAFVIGHTRRDINRIRLARLRVLVRREISRLERESATEEYFSFYATSCRLTAQSLMDRLEGVIDSVDCEAYGVLLDHLLIQRSNLHARRKFQWEYWDALDDFNKARVKCPILPVVDPASKYYGKLYEGLSQSFTLDTLHNERRFHIRYRHRLLPRIYQTFFRLFRSAKVVSPP